MRHEIQQEYLKGLEKTEDVLMSGVYAVRALRAYLDGDMPQAIEHATWAERYLPMWGSFKRTLVDDPEPERILAVFKRITSEPKIKGLTPSLSEATGALLHTLPGFTWPVKAYTKGAAKLSPLWDDLHATACKIDPDEDEWPE